MSLVVDSGFVSRVWQVPNALEYGDFTAPADLARRLENCCAEPETGTDKGDEP